MNNFLFGMLAFCIWGLFVFSFIVVVRLGQRRKGWGKMADWDESGIMAGIAFAPISLVGALLIYHMPGLNKAVVDWFDKPQEGEK